MPPRLLAMESSTAAIFCAILFVWAVLPLLFTQAYQPTCYIGSVGLLVFICLSLGSTMPSVFIVLLFFRSSRLPVNLVAFCFYNPVAVSDHPKPRARDVTIIVPTVKPYGVQFDECIRSIHTNRPAEILVVTAGLRLFDMAVQSTVPEMVPHGLAQQQQTPKPVPCAKQTSKPHPCSILRLAVSIPLLSSSNFALLPPPTPYYSTSSSYP